MTDYYSEEELNLSKKQRKNTLIIYFIVLGVYILATLGVIIYYITLPYSGYKDTSKTITIIKLIEYSVTGLFVIFSFLFLGIKFKRINRYYKICLHMCNGLRETSTGSFLEYDENIQDKDGVDFKSLIFIEWNKYKNDFFERKVLVFYEKPFPEIPVNANVRYITQGNVLISYEILN